MSALSVEGTDEFSLVASMAGRTIVTAEWFDPPTSTEWTGHEYCRLTLDDGRTIEFGGWGHDAWGATVELVEDPK